MTAATAVPQRRSPAGPKAEQRVRDILRVGREVFAERGYERATTTEIAQRLGISEATVFTYFRGKRELCMRVIQDWYDEIIAAIEAGLPRAASVREQLEFVVLTHLRLFLIQGTGLCALVLSEGRTKGQDLGEGFVELQRRYTAPLMDLLARGQAPARCGATSRCGCCARSSSGPWSTCCGRWSSPAASSTWRPAHAISSRCCGRRCRRPTRSCSGCAGCAASCRTRSPEADRLASGRRSLRCDVKRRGGQR